MSEEQGTTTAADQVEKITEEEAPASVAYTVTHKLNQRSAPSMDADVATVLDEGEKITGRDTGDGWIEVDGGGYVRADYVKAAPRRRKGKR